MTYEEALNEVQTKALGHADDVEMEISKDCYKTIVKALKKQTPTMITHEATLYRDCTCPSCGNVVSKFEKWGDDLVMITQSFCSICGQALKWGEDFE